MGVDEYIFPMNFMQKMFTKSNVNTKYYEFDENYIPPIKDNQNKSCLNFYIDGLKLHEEVFLTICQFDICNIGCWTKTQCQLQANKKS